MRNVKLITGDYDTILFASDIDVSFEMIPLLRKKVVVNNIWLNDVVVHLESDSSGVLNLLSFFPQSNKTDESDSGAGNKWEVQLDKSHLQNINFSYTDQSNGILIKQTFADADLTFDHFSLLEKRIDVRDIIINQSYGLASVATSVDEKTDEDTIPSSWKFSAKKIDLLQLQYTFLNPVSKQRASVELKQATLELQKLDLSVQEIIVAQLNLSQPEVLYGIPVEESGLVDSVPDHNSGKNNWTIKCNSLNVDKGNFTLVENSDSSIKNIRDWLPVRNFNTAIRDFVFSSKEAGLNVHQLSFSLNDKLFLQSANAKVGADENLEGKLSLDMVFSTINDPSGKFTRGDTVSITTALDGSLDYLKISTLNIKTNSGVELDVNGSLSGLNHIAESRINLSFQTNSLSQHQTQRVISLFDNTIDLPPFKSYVLTGDVRNTLNYPDFNLLVRSGSGNIDLKGKYNLENRYCELNGSFANLLTGEILGGNYPENISASIAWSGKVGGLNEISGMGALKISEVKFKDYTTHDFNLEFSVDKSLCYFNVMAADTNLICNLDGEFGWNNSIYLGKVNGNFWINEGRTNLLPNHMAVESYIDVAFIHSSTNTDASVKLDTIVLHQNNETVTIDSILWKLTADKHQLQSEFKSDFLEADLNSNSSLKEFLNAIGTVGIGKALSADSSDFLNAANISAIPVFDFIAEAKYDSIFGFFVPDTIFRFKTANMSLRKTPDENKVKLEFSTDSISYLNAHAFGTKINVVTEEKQLSGILTIDSTRVNQTTGGLARAKVDILSDRISGSLFIADSSGEAVYKLGADALKGKEQILFRTYDAEWIINSNKWNLTDPHFLTWELEKDDFIASLGLHYEQMEISFSGRTSDTMNLDFRKVRISQLLSPRAIPFLPDGILDANINYSNKDKKYLDLNLDLTQLKWKDIYVEHLRTQGYMNIDSAGLIESELISQINDSSEFKIKMLPNESHSGQSYIAGFKAVPVQLIEPFTREYINHLGGYASGTIEYTATDKAPVIDGSMIFNSVTLNVVPLGAWFSIPEDSIVIKNSLIYFDRFEVLDSLKKQLYVDGTLNLQDADRIMSDLQVSLDDIRVMNTTVKDNSEFYGSIIVNSSLKITGPVTKPSIKGNILLQEGTNITYRQQNDISVQETQNVVTFSSLSGDTTEQIYPITRMRENSGLPVIETTIEINPKSIFNFEIASGYDIHIKVSGIGLLNYEMLPNNSMSLTGNYEINQGTAELKFTGWPLKNFDITKGSTLRWDGDVSDPAINLEATSKVEGSYVNPVDGKTRNVDFFVSMKLSDQLSRLNIVFSVKSPDQYISSVLNALPEDEQMRQAVNLLIFESINLPNIESSSNYLDSQINSFWESQLNAITKTSFKNIDLSFGLDSYTQTSSGGAEEEKTSLTYEMEKKFFRDRASVKISGRFNDDPQAGQQANTMVENFIFEYELDSLDRKFLKLYTRKDYEDILDGEVTKSGVGFIYRKSYPDFKSIWRRKNREVK